MKKLPKNLSEDFIYLSEQQLKDFIFCLMDCPQRFSFNYVDKKISFIILPEIDNENKRLETSARIMQIILERLNVPERKKFIKNFLNVEKENS